MEVPARKRFWRTCRKLIRVARIIVLVLLLAVVVAGLYLNQIGLPDFLKQSLLEELRARGLDLQFSRLHLSWHRGFVAENARFGCATETPGPNLSAAQVELRPDTRALRKFRLGLEALVIRGGEFAWPIRFTNAATRTLAIEIIETDLRFLPDDKWGLDRFEARFAGAKLRVTGTLAHASALRDLKPFQAGQPSRAGQLEAKLRGVCEALEQVRYAGAPELNLDLRGDALDPKSFTGFLTVTARGVETPWGALTNAELTARLNAPIPPSSLPSARLNLRAGSARINRVGVSDLQIAADCAFTDEKTNGVSVDLNVATGAIATVSGNANAVHIRARLRSADSGQTAHADESWAFWAKLAPCSVDGRVEIGSVESPKLRAKEIVCDAQWRAPDLVLTNLHAKLYGGELDAGLGLNVATRQAGFRCSSDFDVLKITPLLTEAGRRWLSEFAWEKPPKLAGHGSAILPAWTNREPDWHAEVQPTIRLEGDLQIGAASYRGVQVSSASTHFYYSNMCWHLPDLQVIRPEGEIGLVHVSSDRTRDIYWRVNGDVDPKALRPVLDGAGRRNLDRFTFTQPPHVEGEVWASRREKLPRGFVGQVALSNFSFRGESAVSFHSAFNFTNLELAILNPKVTRADGVAVAEKVMVDFAEERVFLTNGFSTIDPLVVARAISPKIAKTVSPYQFLQPPEGRVTGVVPFHGTDGADMLFELVGGPFRWWRFNLPHIRGTVHWAGEEVTLTIADADFYSGKIHGDAFFDSSALIGTDFRFDAAFTNVNLQLLMRDMSTRTNRLEGLLTGGLKVDSANTEDWESWQGRGEAHLRDGYVWEIPLFSIFTPVLNGIVPGLGSTRFSDGSATFAITNSVINYGDLELRAPLLRMKFRGSVDFHEKVDAKVEADLLRDAWIIGPLLSTALRPLAKIFEYKVTGTLTEPKAEPLYVPRLLLAPLQPFRMLKGLLPNGGVSTNAPPLANP